MASTLLPTAAVVAEDDDPDHRVVRIPGLDGVRALGIVLVLCFHGGLGWASGGFLGVDVFFVLSGFLITGLLVAEFRQHRGIGLLRFWGHRVRRLFPALLAVLAAVALYAWLLAPADTLAQLRGDALATLLYLNNWHQVAGSHDYFAALSTPRPLLHTWSLSIEEQFYVLWPLVVLGVLRLTRSMRALLWVAAGLGLASAVAMAVAYDPGVGASRAYFGTDTRVQALLVGACLALVLARPLPARSGTDPSGALVRDWSPSRRSGRWIEGLGVVGLSVIIVMAAVVEAGSSWPYRGGFLLLALATAGLIASVALAPTGPVARVLSLRPVRYLGAISYGLYLWHWPIFVVLTGQRTGLAGPGLFAVRLAVSILVAAASFHVLEMPIRRGTLLTGWRGWLGLPVTIGLVVVGLVVVTSTPPVALAAGSRHGLSATDQERLTRAGAFSGRPIRFMLLGDSVAETIGFGLGFQPGSWGVTAQFTLPTPGCDLDPEDQVRYLGAQIPAGDACSGWHQRWAGAMAEQSPEVVGLMFGRWEIVDHLHHGVWMHIGDPAWDGHLSRELSQLIELAESHDAKVLLFTMPYVAPPPGPDGRAWPEDSKARVDAYNHLLRQVAARHPSVASVYDLNAVVDPKGVVFWAPDGTPLRMSDGIHFTYEAGGWLRPRVLPVVARLGLEARRNAA